MVGNSESLEKLFLYFNRDNTDIGTYSEQPLTDVKNNLLQVAGFCEDVPILAFSERDSAMLTLEALASTAKVSNESFSIGLVVILDDKKSKDKHFKIFDKYLKWIKTIEPVAINRIVFFLDLKTTKTVNVPGEEEGYGLEDFLPLDLLLDNYQKELNRYNNLINEIFDDILSKKIIAAFDVMFYPISTKNNVGLEPSSVALIMESDN